MTHSTFPPIFQIVFIRNQTARNKQITHSILQYSRVQCEAMRIPNILVRIWKKEENIQTKMIQE